jgi:competence protein ComEA
MAVNPNVMTLGAAAISLWLATTSSAQDQLPEAPGKKTVATVCGACHDLDTAVGMRRDKPGWRVVVGAMAQRGARATDEEFAAIVEYLAKYFGMVNVNTATSKELEDVLEISSSESAAIVRYRTDNGDFKDLENLKKVPAVDAKLLEERKDHIVFK